VLGAMYSLKVSDMMKKLLAILLVMVTLVTGCSRVTETPTSLNHESIVKAFFEAANSSDIEKCLGFLSDDITVRQDPPGVTIKGRGQYETILKEATILHRQHTIITPLQSRRR